MPKIRISILSVLAIATSLFSFTSSQAEASPKTFEQWCQQKASISDGAKNTVEALLEEAATQDCKAASKKLASLTELSIDHKKISNLEPISSLSNLTSLYLVEIGWRGEIEIKDLTPLSKLTKLTRLALWASDLKDITPLSKLTALEYLSLNENGIRDVSPLARLSKLESLDLTGNQVVDVKPLARLPKLESLNLIGNPVSSLKPLSNLPSLRLLNLSKTRFKTTDCPVKPTSICEFF